MEIEESIVQEIESRSKKYYKKNDPGHDWNHVLRVVDLCKKMSNDLGGNERVLIPAALLHDIVCLPKNHADSSSSSSKAAIQSLEILEDCGFSELERAEISNATEDHS